MVSRAERPPCRSGWAFCAFVLLLWPSLIAAQTPAGTHIASTARVSYETEDGRRVEGVSNRVVLVVAQVAGVDLEPSRHSVARPGDEVVFPHLLRNAGNGVDRFVLAAHSSSGWTAELFVDLDGDGAPAQDEQRSWSDPLGLGMGESTPLLVRLRVPEGRDVRGATDTLRLTATSEFSGTVTDGVTDRVDVQDAGVRVSLQNAVDPASATTGDLLTYTVRYSVAGTAPVSAFVLTDSVPAGTEYVPGTIRWNGAASSDAAGDDEAGHDPVARQVRLALDSVAPGTAGELTFQVRLREARSPVSTARASYMTRVGRDSVASNTVRTALVFPNLTLTKTLLTAPVVVDGDSVVYVLEYANRSDSVPAHDAVLVDTLPEGLSLLDATRQPEVNGRELRWELGTLPPDSAGTIRLVTRVQHDGLETTSIINRAALRSTSAEEGLAVVASAAAVSVDNATASGLTITHTADVLEVGLGEVAPYTIVVENTGEFDLETVRVVGVLPVGARLVPGTASGADSVVATVEGLTFLLASGLPVGAQRRLRYTVAITSARGQTLRSVARATAVDGRVRSAEAMALLRVRRVHAMATRVAIGKVWVDEDGDGVQGPGEAGVSGVDIWSDGGEVVTTDEEGRFSIRNIEPGQRSFRLDPATLPLAFGPGPGAESDLEVREASGWSTPRVSFPLVPREARLTEVELPLDVSFVARPIRGDELIAALGPAPVAPADSVCVEQEMAVETPEPRAPIRLDNVEFELDRTVLTSGSREILNRIADVFLRNPGLEVEVAGHTDATGSHSYNQDLSLERARVVVEYLVSRGVDAARLTPRGYGPDRPVASNETAAGRARNRRVEMALEEESEAAAVAAKEIARAIVCTPVPAPEPPPRVLGEYRLEVRNPYDVALSALVYQPDRSFDSLQIRLNGEIMEPAQARQDGELVLPALPPRSELHVLGWFSEHPDSAVVALSRSGSPAEELLTLRADFHNPLAPVMARPMVLRLDSLPRAGVVPAGALVRATLDARQLRGDTAFFRVPGGWRVDGKAVGFRSVRDRDGSEAVAFAVADGSTRRLILLPAAEQAAVESVTVQPLRTPEERGSERRRAILAGPGVEFFHPLDGSVHASDRLFVGVKGEPGAAVALLEGDSILREATLRPDGVADFVAVELEEGPHRLRVRMTNSWGKERWDSIAVHVSGRPAEFTFDRESLSLVSDGHTLGSVRARVVDAWGVPVITSPSITVGGIGAAPAGGDTDPSSVGVQLQPDAAGWLRMDVRPGHVVGPGELRLGIRNVEGRLPLEVLPAARPLMVTAVGRVGVGAAAESFGAVTVRGRLDERTSVTVRYDSRQQGDALDAFDRSVDPLDPSQYPLLGDAGERRTEGSTRGAFSAEIRRGFNVLTMGDLTTAAFTDGLELTAYHRALTGAAARVETGPATWQAFASSTSQNVMNDRIRGQGISGPYSLDGAVLPGTDRVTLETRALDNADRVLATQLMARWVDYEIDYESGVLLFRRPVPAVDEHGNPVFIAVTFETRDAGAAHTVWGLRGTTSASELVGLESAQVDLGGTVIRDEDPSGAFQLTGGNLRVAVGERSEVRAEVSHAASSDSSGLAVSLEGRVTPLEGLELEASWRSIGDGYHNPSSGRYRSGSSELRVEGAYEVGPSTVTVSHERQAFSAFDVERERTRLGVEYPVATDVTVEAAVLNDGFAGATDLQGAPAGEAKVSWEAREDLTLWVDGRRHRQGQGTLAQPDFAGVGVEYDITDAVRLTGRHREVAFVGPEGEDGYGVSDIGLRSRFGTGEVWSTYQLAGIDGGRSAALVGLSNQVSLGSGWTIGGSMERRMGVAAADPADPIRALPFLQREEDYWATTLSVQHVPGSAPYRVSGRGEYRDGETRSTRMLELAGELSLHQGLALLARQELMQVETTLDGEVEADRSRRVSSLVGLAFRPIEDDRLNVLGTLQWLDAVNPIGGGVLTSRGDERRLIAAIEAIYEPARAAELALRVASRRAEASQLLEDGTDRRLTSSAQFIGWRAAAPLRGRFGGKVEGRTLVEQNTGSVAFDIAPQVTFAPIPALELAAGYRFGDLRDPDFAVSGGPGAFFTVGARVTERTLSSAAAFWRERVGR